MDDERLGVQVSVELAQIVQALALAVATPVAVVVDLVAVNVGNSDALGEASQVSVGLEAATVDVGMDNDVATGTAAEDGGGVAK